MAQTNGRTIPVPAESLPVLDDGDVVIVGGGTAGFVAATAAARAGVNTVLVERWGYLGGCSTAPYNTSLGWFGDPQGNLIIRGIGYEFLERMAKDGQAFIKGDKNQIWPPYTKKIAFDMVTEAGVNLWLYTWASDILRNEDGTIKGIIVQTKGGRGVILGKTFVDCSADADLAAWAGAPFEMEDPDELQQVSIDYIACGVDAKRVIEWARVNKDSLNLKVSGLEVEHQDYGAQPMFTITIPNADTTTTPDGKTYHVGVMPTVKLCIYREAVRLQGNVNINPLDPKSLTYAEVEGIKGALAHLNYLRDTVPGFEGAFIVTQNHLGVRESRRILGDYYISIDDLEQQARFDDVVALNCRALDYHLKGTVFKISFLGGEHDIPLRALLPRNVENLVVAGRCISCDHLAHASIRGAATCMATGHAAGVAAAVASSQGKFLRDVNIRDIQVKLLEQDAILSKVDGRAPWTGSGYALRERYAESASAD